MTKEIELRSEFVEAFKLKAIASEKLSEAKAIFARGDGLVKETEAELAGLESAASRFEEHRIRDHAFEVLTAIRGGAADIPNDVRASDSGHMQKVHDCKERLKAFISARASLGSDLDVARDDYNRASRAAQTLSEALFMVAVERGRRKSHRRPA